MLRDQLKTLFKNSSPTTVVFSLRSLSFFPTSLHVVSHCSSLHILFLSHQFTLLSGSFLQPLRSLACDGAWSSLPPGLAPPRMLLRTPRISESSASASIPASVGPLVLLREGPKHFLLRIPSLLRVQKECWTFPLLQLCWGSSTSGCIPFSMDGKCPSQSGGRDSVMRGDQDATFLCETSTLSWGF